MLALEMYVTMKLKTVIVPPALENAGDILLLLWMDIYMWQNKSYGGLMWGYQGGG
jgi:hypothetical protein